MLFRSCPVCHGSGIVVGYLGPYGGCVKFSGTQQHIQYSGEAAGMDDVKNFSIEALGFPRLVYTDIVAECKSDRRYSVVSTVCSVEIRRIPIVQEVNVVELPTDFVIYSLGAPV